MKWQVKVGDEVLLRGIEAASHEEALRAVRGRYEVRFVPTEDLEIEPQDEPGRTHDCRFYSQSGPVLREEDL